MLRQLSVCSTLFSTACSSNVVAGALYRQRLQPDRLFMTFLETEAMNGIYKEAEALLIAGGGVFF